MACLLDRNWGIQVLEFYSEPFEILEIKDRIKGQ